MNIFYVDTNPTLAAQQMVDKHVVKMILESMQLLSTAHRVLDGKLVNEQKYVTGSLPARFRKTTHFVLPDERENVLYKATHMNHPSAIWARESLDNYNWLIEHAFALMDEYTFRYSKQHKCSIEVAPMLIDPPKNIPNIGFTKMPSCMDEQYIISDDPVINYQNYYRLGKSNIHAWKNRSIPEWI